ncbi:hypothetical protein E1265_18040 [Streptomyces sp. 8K308]|uniref:hypothetical protein n=1 Tax=Streptomyces sp. 8K308 TaxID=2530388 RepID=UPI00104BBCD2|nr:hypothetical protein [Streptomyces sp. 8K308]TDC21434.1 hypothetical protein E1265_18040 [Streptomyces sp. 8K308]
MTCVWTRETAACRQNKIAAGLPDTDIPDETECRSACTNLSHTDRHLHHLHQQLPVLEARAGDVMAPRPLRDRAAAQAQAVRAIIDRHEHSRPPQPHTSTEPPGGGVTGAGDTDRPLIRGMTTGSSRDLGGSS